MGVLGVLAAAVLGGAMAWLVIAPVSRMGQAMGKIASGDFSEPVQVENQDELGELAGRINQTSEELAKLQEATLGCRAGPCAMGTSHPSDHGSRGGTAPHLTGAA